MCVFYISKLTVGPEVLILVQERVPHLSYLDYKDTELARVLRVHTGGKNPYNEVQLDLWLALHMQHLPHFFLESPLCPHTLVSIFRGRQAPI